MIDRITNAQIASESPAFAKPMLAEVPLGGVPISEVYLMDCVEGMKYYPDKYFDLAICDPPYGIHDKLCRKDSPKNKSKFNTLYYEKQWDKERPKKSFWNEVFRVSKNQVVFGANYFCNELPISRGWAYWHKQGEKMSSVNDELIWTSFDISIKKFSRCHGMDKGFMSDHKVFHPTTKPVALYDWVFSNYSESGMKVLDTHLGSGSSRISANKNGLNFVGFEIDEEYFNKQNKRYADFTAQTRLW